MARSDEILVVINLAWSYVVPQKYLKWIDHFYGFCGKKRTDHFVFESLPRFRTLHGPRLGGSTHGSQV